MARGCEWFLLERERNKQTLSLICLPYCSHGERDTPPLTGDTQMNDHSVTTRVTDDMPVIVRYDLIDGHTGYVLCSYRHRTAANNRRDKLDNEYGAYRYKVRAVWSDEV